MKKLNILAGLMMLLVMMFTACDDDLSKNPTLQSPSTFKLNTPSYAATNVNLATSDSLIMDSLWLQNTKLKFLQLTSGLRL
jgi:hypothetical protein